MKDYEFSIHDVKYILTHENNKTIPPFQNWAPSIAAGTWEPETFEIFKKFANKEKHALDIGGWLGPTAIYLSKTFKWVHVVEADKNALEALKKNMKANNCENWTLVPKPIFEKAGEQIYFGQNGFVKLGLGFSASQLRTEGIEGDDVMTTTDLDEIISGVDGEIGLIKLDIEGGEENIIPRVFEICKELKCPLWLGFHTHWWKNSDVSRFSKYFDMALNVTSSEIIKKCELNPLSEQLFIF